MHEHHAIHNCGNEQRRGKAGRQYCGPLCNCTDVQVGTSDHARIFATVSIDLIEGGDVRTSAEGAVGSQTAVVTNVALMLT